MKISFGKISTFSRKERTVVKEISNIAFRLHRKAYLVGGFVRDLFLGKDNRDLDCVINGDVLDFALPLARKFSGKFSENKKFRTAKVDFGSFSVDFAQVRRENYPESGALPQVSQGSFEDDIFRRDFTINAIYISLNRKDFGKVLCRRCVEDLEKGLIRIFHRRSFLDDPTRIIRAVRFSSRLGFKMEPLTLRSLKEAVKDGALSKISSFRIKREIFLLLKETDVVKPVRKLFALGILKSILPEVKKIDFGQLSYSRKILHEFYLYLARDFNVPLYYILVISKGLSLPSRRSICQRLSFSRMEEKALLCDFRKIRRIVGYIKKGTRNWTFLADEFSEEVILFIASLLPPSVEYRRKIVKYFTSVKFKKTFHTNRELLRMGVPAEKLGGVNKILLKYRRENRIKNRLEEYDFLRKKFLS